MHLLRQLQPKRPTLPDDNHVAIAAKEQPQEQRRETSHVAVGRLTQKLLCSNMAALQVLKSQALHPTVIKCNDRETEQLLRHLRSENVALRKKCRSLELAAITKPNRRAKRPPLSSASSPQRPSSPQRRPPPPPPHVDDTEGDDGEDRDQKRVLIAAQHQEQQQQQQQQQQRMSAIVVALRSKLEALQTSLVSLSQENERLRMSGGEYALEASPAARGTGPERQAAAPTAAEVAVLAQELRSKGAQLALLQGRFASLCAKRESEAVQLSSAENAVRELSEERAATRAQNRKLVADTAQLEAVLEQFGDMEQGLAREKQQRIVAEHRLDTLLEQSFAKDSGAVAEQLSLRVAAEEQVHELTDELARVRAAAAEEAETLESARRQAAAGRDDAREATEKAVQRAALADIEVERQRGHLELLQRKLQMYAREEGNMDEADIERALGLVVLGKTSAMGGADTSLSFLAEAEPSAADPGATTEVERLRRQLNQLQSVLHPTNTELKRHQELLRTQESINADLKAETEELKQRYSRHVQSATEELAAAQETSKQRLVRAQKREAQLREALYVTSRRGVPQDTTANPMEGAPASDEMSTAERTDDSAQNSASTNELLSPTAAELGLDENRLSVWLRCASLDDCLSASSSAVAEASSQFFVICEFFDFEPQVSPLIGSFTPNFDFVAQFGVRVDKRLLEHLHSESLTLELHRVHAASSELVGTCHVPLAPLLGIYGKCTLPNEPCLDASSDAVSTVGTMHLELQLARPVAELAKLFVAPCVQQQPRTQTELRPQQLQIEILGCSSLPAGTHAPYVHYQLLGFSDVFTGVGSGRSPLWDSAIETFSLRLDGQLKQFFSKYSLVMTVFDDENKTSEGGALTGVAHVPLILLAAGKLIHDSFPCTDACGRNAGLLEVRIGWLKDYA
jgi:hypothetical protein